MMGKGENTDDCEISSLVYEIQVASCPTEEVWGLFTYFMKCRYKSFTTCFRSATSSVCFVEQFLKYASLIIPVQECCNTTLEKKTHTMYGYPK